MVDHETTGSRDYISGEHRLSACRFRQLAESRDYRTAMRRDGGGPCSVVSSQRSLCVGGFTLAEVLVSVGVLVLLVLLATQLLNRAATITTLGHKRMDADSQAREIFDRMAIDVMQMVKRLDVDNSLLQQCCGLLSIGLQWLPAEYGINCRVPNQYERDNAC